MGHTRGLRRGTRYMFARGFGKHGTIGLATYLKTYKVGDIVDIKVCVGPALSPARPPAPARRLTGRRGAV
jgi:ribosomal protein L21E